jgi:hypothetical protein
MRILTHLRCCLSQIVLLGLCLGPGPGGGDMLEELTMQVWTTPITSAHSCNPRACPASSQPCSPCPPSAGGAYCMQPSSGPLRSTAFGRHWQSFCIGMAV